MKSHQDHHCHHYQQVQVFGETLLVLKARLGLSLYLTTMTLIKLENLRNMDGKAPLNILIFISSLVTLIDEGPIRAGHVLQVISVTIFNNESCSSWEDLEIFGEISITDGQNNTFYIYNYDEDNPDLVSTECDYLFLKGCPVTPVYTGEKVKFSLTDKKSGEKFIEGNYDVNFSIEDAYPSKTIMKCPGKHGFYASMEYTKIPFAFVFEVSMSIEDENKDRAGDFDIHGTIKANDIVLFEEQASDPANMEHGEI